MFLNELNKNEGIAFLQLVKELANVDEVFAKEEKKLYEEYLEELNIKEWEPAENSFDSIYEILKDSSQRKKNIIYFELIGLALIDGVYDINEVNYLDEVGKKLGIERNKKMAFANYFYDFIEIYNFSTVDAESKIDLLKEKADKLLL